MPLSQVTRHLFAALAAAIVFIVFSTLPAAAEGVPAPVISKGKGETCVAETDFMRRNHMQLLLHQRDDTMRLGIRGDKFSLKDCVECHAVPDGDGKPVSVAAPEHFCRTCHDYAAVKIDCFQCHNSRPEEKKKTAAAGWRSLTGMKW